MLTFGEKWRKNTYLNYKKLEKIVEICYFINK